MEVINHLFSAFFTVAPTSTYCLSSHAEADQNDYINGLPSYSKLYREQFIAALFLTVKFSDEDAILESPDYRRMVMLVTAVGLPCSGWGSVSTNRAFFPPIL